MLEPVIKLEDISCSWSCWFDDRLR